MTAPIRMMPNSSFGLFDYNFAPKEAATAFQSIANLASTCDTYAFTVNRKNKTITAAFNYEVRTTYVIWAYEPAAAIEVCFTTGDLRPIELKDVSGNRLPIQACDEKSLVKLELSAEGGPVILEVSR